MVETRLHTTALQSRREADRTHFCRNYNILTSRSIGKQQTAVLHGGETAPHMQVSCFALLNVRKHIEACCATGVTLTGLLTTFGAFALVATDQHEARAFADFTSLLSDLPTPEVASFNQVMSGKMVTQSYLIQGSKL